MSINHKTEYSFPAEITDPAKPLNLAVAGNTFADVKSRSGSFASRAASNPDAGEVMVAAVDLLPVLSEEEQQQVLYAWNDTRTAFPGGKCIQELFEEQVANYPDAVAVVSDEACLSYGELNRRANQLGHHLRELGVRPDARVAICAERGPEMIVAILAVLKAGGAYVPLDPSYPSDRLRFMLEDCAPELLLVGASIGKVLPGVESKLRVVDLASADAPWHSLPEANLDTGSIGLTSEHLAYVIYTSGSTGMPKGVMVNHRNVIRLVKGVDYVRFSHQDRILQMASMSFDAATFEVWGGLLHAGQLIVMSARVPSLEQIAQMIQEHQITIAWLTASLFHLMVESELESLKTIRQLIAGGEVLHPGKVRRSLEAMPQGHALINGYGPTECTTFACCYRMEDAEHSRSTIPIGAPIANTFVYILDEYGEPAPVSVPGELYIGGAGVARGYWNRAESTAERFLPDPFSADLGARMYRTGDLARWLADGNIDFLGRNDSQVKIRGFRIELGEIEARLMEQGDVLQTVVIARQDDDDDKRLVAYYTAAAEGQSPERLRSYLSALLPDYMVPAAYVCVESFPLTPNGKLDHKALPAPGLDAYALRSHEPPQGEVETKLAAIWAEVLKLDRVGRHENFFELGGHSLLVTRIMARLRQEMRVKLPLRSLFRAQTIASFGVTVSAALSTPETKQYHSIVRVDKTGPWPLSSAQRRLWFIDRLENNGSAYNTPVLLRLEGILRRVEFERTVQYLANRHRILQSRYFMCDDQLLQEVTGHPVPLVYTDIETSAELEALEAAEREAARAFNLETGPLFRVTIWKIRSDLHLALLNFHHSVIDGWSLSVLAKELSSIYNAYLDNQEPLLPKLPFQYADYAAWEWKELQGDAHAPQLAYWRKQLSSMPVALNLASDRSRTLTHASPSAIVRRVLPAALSRRLRDLSLRTGATLFMTLLAGFKVLLQRYTGQADLAVGTPIARRDRSEIEPLIGFFVNILVVRTQSSPQWSFQQLLQHVRDVSLGAFAHQDLPFEKLVEALHPERDRGYAPMFEVMFTLHKDPAIPFLLRGLKCERIDAKQSTTKIDLCLAISDSGDQLTVTAEYSVGPFQQASMERMLEHYELILQGATTDPGLRLQELPLLSASEQQTFRQWESPVVGRPIEESLSQLFETTVSQSPNSVALIESERQLTYRDLNERANRLANYLVLQGVVPGTAVCVCANRSIEAIVAMLAVVKAGGFYVPLEPTCPTEHLRSMMLEIAAPIVLGLGSAGRDAAVAARWVDLSQLEVLLGEQSDSNQSLGMGSDSLACVMYTSGSTGRAKGISVTQRAVAQLARQDGFVKLGPRLRILHAASLMFDVSTFEIWGTLLNGAALVILNGETVLDAARFAHELRRQRVTTLFLTTALFNESLRAKPDIFATVEQVLFGGDIEDSAIIRQALGPCGPRKLIHVYGPTETGTFTTHSLLKLLPEGERAPIGKPSNCGSVYVLDDQLRRLPVGVAGELYVAGPGVAQGYWRQPGLTAERFLPHPYSTHPGETLYRTGDRVRWRPDGQLEFLGRRDDQVEISGHRIEPAEVEIVLRELAGVRDAAVIVREHIEQGKQMIAYVVREQNAASLLILRQQAADQLPAFKLPHSWMELEHLPLNQQGKLDRTALPEPTQARAESGDGYVEPRTPEEQILCGLWAEILGLERVSAEKDFFALGGHSLLATQLIVRVRRVLDVEVEMQTLFDYPTPREFAGQLKRLNTAESNPPLLPKSQRGPTVLSYAQQRLWFLQQLWPTATNYNIVHAMRLTGQLNREALRRAVEEIVRRHEVLRTRIQALDGQVLQVVEAPPNITLVAESLGSSTVGSEAEKIQEWLQSEIACSFDLHHGPLWRARLLRISHTEYVFSWAMHHIASDGWSVGVLMRELGVLYRAYSQGENPQLSELAVQYADYAAWQHDFLQGATLKRELVYWREQLDGLKVLELPTDHARMTVLSHHGGRVPVHIPSEVAQQLRQLSRQGGATLFMTLLLGFGVLLQRYSGQDDITVGTPIAGRTQEDLEELIGFFTNTLPLRLDLSGDPSVAELLGRVKRTALEAYAHQHVPFERLVEELQPERDIHRNPLFQVMFVLQNAPISELTLPGIQVTPVDTPSHTAKFDMLLGVTECADGSIEGGLEYHAELYEPETAIRIVEHWVRLLASLAAAPKTNIANLEMLNLSERKTILQDWNATARPFPRDMCLHHWFQQSAAISQSSVAVRFEDAAINYGDLDILSNRLAHVLRRYGVGPDSRVALLVDRSIEMIVGMLAILKAGGAYVPLDPEYPRARLEFLLSDSSPQVIVTRASLSQKLPQTEVPAIHLDSDWPMILAASPDPVQELCDPQNAAYVIYTSGSTGQPKGVIITHRNAAAFLSWCQAEFVGSWQAVAATTSICFDLSIFEIFFPLSIGKPIRLLPSAMYLEQYLALEPDLLVNTVPSMLKHLQEAGVDLAQAANVNMAGEPISPHLARLLPPGLPVRNLYGPSEDTTYSTFHRLRGEGDHVLIGKPLANRRTYLLDRFLRPVPVGVSGELYIAGAGLARGYWQRPDLTAERFIANPYGHTDGERLYRTGDLARFRPDGNLEFLGRIDAQVKVRGYRVELGEIETILGRHEEIREALVVALGEINAKSLVAYYVARTAPAPTSQALRFWLRNQLPEHMIPARFIELESIPLTPNGKINRKALPLPEVVTESSSDPITISSTEQLLMDIWKEVLGVNSVGLDDNFFHIGGHSLLVLTLAQKIEVRLGTPMAAINIFLYMTIRSMADFLSHSGQSKESSATMHGLQDRVEGRDKYLSRIRSRKPSTSGYTLAAPQ